MNYSLSCRLLRRSLLSCAVATLLSSQIGLLVAQDQEEAMLHVSRTLGFRPASFMTLQSDYTFEISDDGAWKYRAFASTKDGAYMRKGEVKSLESFVQQLQKIDLNSIPAPDPNAPRIADLPEMNVRMQVDGKPWHRGIPPRDAKALALHRLIQSVVMGVIELDPESVPAGDMKPGQAEKPTVIERKMELEALFSDAKAMEVLTKAVDFKSQKLVVFNWAGSGRDDVYVAVDTDDDGKESIRFGYRRGMTRDLRPHRRLYVIPADQEWTVKVDPAARPLNRR